MNKRGQMKLSFGMIFSIILIIVFITFAFMAVKQFLSIQNAVNAGKFIDNVRSEVEKIWKGSQGSQSLELYLPAKVEKVCFVDYSTKELRDDFGIYKKLKQIYYEYENMFFYPIGSAEGLDAVEIKHLNMNATTQYENPLCFENQDGKIKMVLKKNYGESLVRIVRP